VKPLSHLYCPLTAVSRHCAWRQNMAFNTHPDSNKNPWGWYR